MEINPLNMSCPVPLNSHSRILLGHGSGGALTHELIDRIFAPAFDNPLLRQSHDGAVTQFPGQRMAVTTDSYVVQPLFFPGGDIGRLAVCGSVNDLAMCGAHPLYLTAAFILEEGFEIAQLSRIVDSMRQAAAECGVAIITGDTKVVGKGNADGVFINTTGIGVIERNMMIAPASIREGDAILLSGDIGRHGMAIMAAREGLLFENVIESDLAPLAQCVQKLIDSGVSVHCLRDLTRGGLANALVELSRTARLGIHIEEREVITIPPVRGACEILGLDVMHVANEGRFVSFVPQADVDAALSILKKYPGGEHARCIGRVVSDNACRVVLKNAIGTSRIIQMLAGELLPRIC
ncbi:MAG: hydrogenase expression/formation protein HypE [Candidatus Omnitrophica bacterium]|nr:hydrogenase expression/formation protein HypE [Candidatus Omnitrophota bacterium]